MLLSVAAMIGTAAPVYADDPDPSPTNDASFLKEMSDAGLTYHDGSQAVAAAKNVCDMANKGTSESEIEKKLQDVNSFSGNGAKKFIMLAAKSYCPKQLEPDESPAPKAPGQ
ncbi:hypothetical protein MCOO_08280 [Mycobacterium cookii]|uniref:DUF732 domain-containing protein n=2 Tax=Mycobacterium cookii TaxID=1775 RepID=A0A7I7KS95_9MYCO|nr:hypothetical protein MCOO_08280 [Mycobacterium cookii]